MSIGTLSTLRLARRRGHRRGFTLVELMVAVTGGLFVSLAVFAISRQTGRFYTRETRVTDATLASMVGFERIKAERSDGETTTTNGNGAVNGNGHYNAHS